MSEDGRKSTETVKVDHIEVWCQYCLKRLRQDEQHDCRPALALYINHRRGPRGR